MWSNICPDWFPRKAIESPSLEIFKTQLDTVLDSLLYMTRFWAEESDSVISRGPTQHQPFCECVNLWFCVKQLSLQMSLIAFCTAESTQTLRDKHWQAKAIPAMVQTVITHDCVPLVVHVWFVHVVIIAPNKEGPTSLCRDITFLTRAKNEKSSSQFRDKASFLASPWGAGFGSLSHFLSSTRHCRIKKITGKD